MNLVYTLTLAEYTAARRSHRWNRIAPTQRPVPSWLRPLLYLSLFFVSIALGSLVGPDGWWIGPLVFALLVGIVKWAETHPSRALITGEWIQAYADHPCQIIIEPAGIRVDTAIYRIQSAWQDVILWENPSTFKIITQNQPIYLPKQAVSPPELLQLQSWANPTAQTGSIYPVASKSEPRP